MFSTPLISLILCLKNGMPYLSKAIDSVRAQTYRHFELIAQDGGSTDGSLEFLEQVSGIPSVQIESAPDTGTAQAYNRAIQRCKGDIIGSIDADNLLGKEALTIIVKRLEQYPDCAAIYGQSNIIDEQGQTIEPFTHTHGPFDLLRLMRCDLVPPFATSFFSRVVCGDELRFNEKLKICADFDLWLRISHLPIIMIPNVVGSTRISEKSLTCSAENYDQFCDIKISSLKYYLARYEWNILVNNIYRHSVAGIYLWAAESVYRLEGASDRFNQYCERASALDPYSKRLRKLKEQVAREINIQFKNKLSASKN